MQSRTICFCLAGLLAGITSGYGETFHQYRDASGALVFTNTLPPHSLSEEKQRARDQAEIEYWRSMEARARSLRHTPDTEVHRKRSSSLQGENPLLEEGPGLKRVYKKSRPKRKPGGADEENRVSDCRELKKVRGKKTKVQTRKKGSNAEPRAKNTGRLRVKAALQ